MSGRPLALLLAAALLPACGDDATPPVEVDAGPTADAQIWADARTECAADAGGPCDYFIS